GRSYCPKEARPRPSDADGRNVGASPSPHGAGGLPDSYGMGGPHAPKFSDRSVPAKAVTGSGALYRLAVENQYARAGGEAVKAPPVETSPSKPLRRAVRSTPRASSASRRIRGPGPHVRS